MRITVRYVFSLTSFVFLHRFEVPRTFLTFLIFFNFIAFTILVYETFLNGTLVACVRAWWIVSDVLSWLADHFDLNIFRFKLPLVHAFAVGVSRHYNTVTCLQPFEACFVYKHCAPLYVSTCKSFEQLFLLTVSQQSAFLLIPLLFWKRTLPSL